MDQGEERVLIKLMRKGAWLAGAVLLSLAPAMEGSWNNILISPRTAALGGAGVSVPGDPTSIFFNPAGLSGMSSVWTVELDAFTVGAHHSYSLDGGPEAHSRRAGVVPQGFMAYAPASRWAFGFGVFLAYASGGVDWKRQDTGLPLKSALGIYSLSPAVSYRLNERFSVGLALNVYLSALSLTSELEPFGLIENNESGAALAASLGLLAEPVRGVSLGFCLKTPARVKTKGRTALNFEGVNIRFPSETSFDLPWHIEAGVSFRASARLLIAASAEYAMWSSLEKLDKVFRDVPFAGDVAVPAIMNYRNILIIRAGLEWRISSAWTGRAGFSWDPAAAPEESLNLGNIDVDKQTLSLGCGWHSGATRLDFACGYALGTPRTKTSGTGDLQTEESFDVEVFFLSLGLRWSGKS